MIEPLQRLKTGIDGLDTILCGGLTKDRSTLVAGTSGSAKTVLAVQ
ncbi:MAG TPA: ATPase domain-containing protein, partial [Chroococcales cyanobacterium]